MTFWQFVDANKTKILGATTAVLGFIQAYPALPDLLGPIAYSWTMFAVGIGVTVCGFLNSRPPADKL